MSSCDTNLVSDRRLGQPRYGDPMPWKDLGQTTWASRVWTVRVLWTLELLWTVIGCPESGRYLMRNQW